MSEKTTYQVIATKEIHYIMEVEASSIAKAEEEVYNRIWNTSHDELKEHEDWFDVTVDGSECLDPHQYADKDTEEL